MSSRILGDSRAATTEISPARSERRRRRKCRVSVMVRASPVGTAEILALVSPLKGARIFAAAYPALRGPYGARLCWANLIASAKRTRRFMCLDMT